MLTRTALSAFVFIFGIGAATTGCVGDAASGSPTGGSTGQPTGGSGGTSGGAGSGGSGTGSGGMVSGTGNAPGSGGASASGGTVGTTNPLLPARIRRLTNSEYDASVRVLLGSPTTMAATFPPDSRQGIFARGGYTVNDAQRVDPVLAKQLSEAALAAVTEARSSGRLTNLAPCSNASTGGEACAKTFIASFGAKAYRRTLTDAEAAGLLTVYKTGATGATYNDGIDLVIRALLQSAGFLYVTEIGPSGASGAEITLTNDEAASVLSYLLAASPPDDALLTMARSGGLTDATGRETQARRILATKAGQDATVRFVREMFSLDQIAITDKDTTAYPKFAAAKNSIVNESTDFVREVLTKSTGNIEELLGADWTIADNTLAEIYGVSSAGTTAHTSLASTKRKGILNQAAFLSVFAHASESGPVLRGVAIMRQIACMTVVSPTELNIDVTPPAFDASKTTRQRFTTHSTDAMCASCHKNIDGFGFTFEAYDGMGAARPVMNGKPTENGIAVDTSSTIAAGLDFDGNYADSNALATALSTSAQVRSCLARQIFRSSTGRSDATVRASEEAFVNFWKQQPADKQGNVVETLVSFVKNPTFLKRRPQ